MEYYFNNITIPFHDSGWQPSPIFEDTGLYPDVTYVYQVKVRDISERRNESTYSDSNYSATTEYADMGQPEPDPPVWATEPKATGPYSVSMMAQECTDESGVEYAFFAFGSDHEYDPNHSSGWQDSPIYTDTGLDPNTTYYYMFRVRDKSLNVNYAGYSSYRSATTDGAADTFAPIPGTMTWDQFPTPTGENSITMTASMAADGSGVEYYFENITEAGTAHDSGWQDSNVYNDTGLAKGTEYTYRVVARDKSANQNENAWSTSESATTLADATAPDPIEWGVEPRAIGSHTIIMTADIATAEPGAQYYFSNVTDSLHDSGWQSSEFYEDTGLDPNVMYTYRVKIRDTYENVSTDSADASAKTALAGAVQTLELISVAEHDGRVWGSDTAGIYYNSYDATYMALRVGGKPSYGYRSITSFDTTRSLPTKIAIDILSANLELTCSSHGFLDDSDDPFLKENTCYIDIDNAFSTSPVLSIIDWNYPADESEIADFTLAFAPSEGTSILSTDFALRGKDKIDRNGITQLRIGFRQITFSPTGYVGFYSGEWPGNEPKLIIRYTD